MLCRKFHNNYPEANEIENELFVFGSNHFGQLGIGSSEQPETKTSLPIRLNLGDCSIRLIHTKFFTNVC